MEHSLGELREPHERIRWARLNRTKFIRPTDAARSLNVRPGTYRTWEVSRADGGRIPTLSEMQRIAKKFGVSWTWIASGEDGPDDEPKTLSNAERLASQLNQVDPAKQEDALRAVEGVLAAFRKTA